MYTKIVSYFPGKRNCKRKILRISSNNQAGCLLLDLYTKKHCPALLRKQCFLSVVNDTDTFHRCTILIAADLDTGLRAAGMNYLSSTDINSYVINITLAVTIEYQITGL